ncbi:M28 family peptidase [Limibacter armeniacum]|uniref:M28 family metallopeptidase n=1 Tax=Limibacter armeniacum TaxID=466084 RepID=UPI002FE56CC1
MNSLITRALLLNIFMYCCIVSLSAQDMNRVRKNIAKLCSKKMHGRGYTYGGDRKAADFIQKQFEANGLKPFGDTYFQSFTMPVNAFPEKAKLKVGDHSLKLGEDFIVHPASASANVKGTLVYIPDSVFENHEKLVAYFSAKDIQGKVLVYDSKFERDAVMWPRVVPEKLKKAAGVILLVDKLTFGVSRKQGDVSKLIVRKATLEKYNAEEIEIHVRAEWQPAYQTQNVIGYIEGTKQATQYVVFSAHYDHLGSIGKQVYFPGGNDNATGVAMLLELSRWYKVNPPEHSVVFMGFAAEEAGLVGSRYYVENPLFDLKDIRFLINLDLFASGEEGMMAVNGAVFEKEFNLLTDINSEKQYLPVIQKRGKAANSDHYFFTEAGVPSFFFYLMGKSWQHYHDIYDTGKVPLSRFQGAFQLIRDFSDSLDIEKGMP